MTGSELPTILLKFDYPILNVTTYYRNLTIASEVSKPSKVLPGGASAVTNAANNSLVSEGKSFANVASPLH